MPKAPKPRSTANHAGPYSYRSTNGTRSSSVVPNATIPFPTSSSSATLNQVEEPDYLFRVQLSTCGPPQIVRYLCVPSSKNFEELHDILQIAFDWANYHMYTFRIHAVDGSLRPEPESMLMELQRLPCVFDMPGMNIQKSRQWTLKQVFEHAEWSIKGVKMVYEYDMGDRWQHMVHFLGKADPHLRAAMGFRESQEVFVYEGQGHGCAEDSGSAPGWEHLKKLFKNKKMPDPDDRRGWYRDHCPNGSKDLDPLFWDIDKTNREMVKMLNKEYPYERQISEDEDEGHLGQSSEEYE